MPAATLTCDVEDTEMSIIHDCAIRFILMFPFEIVSTSSFQIQCIKCSNSIECVHKLVQVCHAGHAS